MKSTLLTLVLFLVFAPVGQSQSQQDCDRASASPLLDALAEIAQDTPFIVGQTYTYCVDAEFQDNFLVNGSRIATIRVVAEPVVLPAAITVVNRANNDETMVIDISGEQQAVIEGDFYFIEIAANSVGTDTIFFVPEGFGALTADPDTIAARVIQSPALPVTWGRQLATAPSGKLNRFTWSVFDQVDVEFYELQRERNGVFTTIEYIAPQYVDSGAEVFYEAFDEPIATGTRYRVRQQDYSGVESFSDMVFVQASTQGNLSIYPNPADGLVTVTGLVPIENVVVHNVLGRQLANYIGGEKQLNFDVTDLPAGVYLLSVVDIEGHRQTRRLRVR